MSDHPNAVRIRALVTAFRERNLDAIRESICEDAVWHFPGREGQLAGTHSGHAGVFEFLGRVMNLTDGSFELELEDVLANDSLAVVLFRGHGTRNGRELDNPTCLKIRMEGGRASELWEFVWDVSEVDRFWT